MQKKQGIPEPNELVICTIKKILFHSVFVNLDEYSNVEGMIHISEVAPGRIRNIRDYVREGKKIVCKVLKVNKERNQIDLSLRRVSTTESINKTYEFKQDLKAEKLLEAVAKTLKKDLSLISKEIGDNLIKNFDSLNRGLSEIAEDNSKIKLLKLNKLYEKVLLETINEKIKKQEVSISATIELSSNMPDGINRIKKVLKSISNENTIINYISAPKYKLLIKSSDYKTAESQLSSIREKLIKQASLENCTADFIKDRKR